MAAHSSYDRVDGDETVPPEEEEEEDEVSRRRYKKALGCGYIMAMVVSGMVVTMAGSTLDQLATNCGTTSTKVGTVFIGQGVGTGVGATISPKVYISIRGNTALSVELLLLAVTLLMLPSVSTVVELHVVFFVLGVLVDMITTGSQIMTRKVHGDNSGMWMGCNMVAMGTSSALPSLLCYMHDSLFWQYAVIFATSLAAAVFLGVALPPPETFEGLLEATPKKLTGPAGMAEEEWIDNTESMEERCRRFLRKNSVEFHISGMLICLVGGLTAATTYLSTYVEYTKVIAESQESLLAVDLWMAVAVGIVAGLFDQHKCTLPSLYRHTTVAFLTVGAAGLAILVFNNSAVVLWICIGIFGLACGPTVGYSYELNNRVNVPSETGMSIVTSGLSFGTTVVPYATSLVLEYTGLAAMFIVILVLSRFLPYLLMLNARRLVESRKRLRRSGVDDRRRSASSLSEGPVVPSEVTEETRLL